MLPCSRDRMRELHGKIVRAAVADADDAVWDAELTSMERRLDALQRRVERLTLFLQHQDALTSRVDDLERVLYRRVK